MGPVGDSAMIWIRLTTGASTISPRLPGWIDYYGLLPLTARELFDTKQQSRMIEFAVTVGHRGRH